MANKNALNKNSVYVQSLVDFVLDTKPYHSKLTEIVEEYQFFDDVNVKIEERFTSRTMINSSWLYNYFSSANTSFRTMPLKRMVSPSFASEVFTVGADENKDLALIPYSYSQKAFDGIGVNAVFINQDGLNQRLNESLDFFQSHGSFQFQVKQTRDANGTFNPLWATSTDNGLPFDDGKPSGVLAVAAAKTREQALDVTNPSSAIRRIRVLLDNIQAATNSIGGHAEVQMQLTGHARNEPGLIPMPTSLYGILDSIDLPRSYEALLAWLAIPNDHGRIVPLEAPHDRQWYDGEFSRNSPPLYFGMFTDMGLRENGKLDYESTYASPYIKLTNIKTLPDAEVEEWTITSTTSDPEKYTVYGSSHGFAGFVIAGQSFTTARLSFNTTRLAPPVAGDEIVLTPTRKIVIADGAPLETWNITKVNPIAYSRPVFSSTNFGAVIDRQGKSGSVTIIDQSFETSDLILTARDGGQVFDLANVTNPSYTGVVTVGVPFNDGRLAFTIVAGAQPFTKGDRFYFSIENSPSRIENLDIGFSYDLDPYDDDTISEYLNGNKIGFAYDGRFTDFDLSQLNIQVSQAATDGRKWRVKPVRVGGEKLIKTIDAPAGVLQIYEAVSFVVEYSDNGFASVGSAGYIRVGDTFSDEGLGITFTLVAASKPYIMTSGVDDTVRTVGGDVFSFNISNPNPRLLEEVALDSARVPFLAMRADGFFDAPAAKWVITFDSPTSYKISATTATSTVLPETSITLADGMSLNQFGIHYTIVPGIGFIAGDKFTFETYDEKPTYLVHGSVTGWTAPATVGNFYWNGKIGFKIKAPQIETFVNDLAQGITATFKVREDCLSMVYTFARNTKGYTVTRSDTGEVAFAKFDSVFKDRFLTADLTGETIPNFKVVIDAHDYTLWNTQDLVIINPKTPARLPKLGSRVFVEKTKDSRFALSITPGFADISKLGPVNIDQRFIGTNTYGIPLSNTSPETAILTGWLPLTVKKMDSTTSVAEFNDSAVRYEISSSVSNEPIGVVKQQDPLNMNESIVFEWDEAFYTRYLPLNAETNLVISDTGWNDKLNAHITESVKFLLGGGALDDDWMFHDDVNVKIVDTNFFKINSVYDDDFHATFKDGPFAGFMPGYDNFPYQFERGGDINNPNTGGAYDAGYPPDYQSLISKYLLTEQERADALSRWNNFMQGGTFPTTQQQWEYLYNALDIDPTGDLTRTSGFGIPALGLGMDITSKPVNQAKAAFKEAIVTVSADDGSYYDADPFDFTLLDKRFDTAAQAFGGTLPIVPFVVPPGSTYDSLDGAINLPIGAAKHIQTVASNVWFVITKLRGVIKDLNVTNTAGAPLVPTATTILEDGTIRLDFATPQTGKAMLMIQTVARTFEVTFTANTQAELDAYTPRLSIWIPGNPTPSPVLVLERVNVQSFPGQLQQSTTGAIPNAKSARLFRFSFPTPTEGKIIVG